jgi:CheY-like chemotaxis protein
MPSGKILVVDDDPTVRMFFSDALTFVGYTVLTAASGVHALVLAQAELPDLIVMDCQMPGMSGPEALERLRQNPATRSIPVLGVTGEMTGAFDAVITAAPTACLPKPVSLDTLYEVIAGLLRAVDREEQDSS